MAGSSDDDGQVAREIVLAVLAREGGVSVSKNGDEITLAKGELADVYVRLPAKLGRNMLHRFSRRFGIEIHRFYVAETVAETQAASKRS